LLNEAGKDLDIYNKLQTRVHELSRLNEMVRDTHMLAGAELYRFARVTYKMAKISTSLNVPRTKSIVDDLGRLITTQEKTVQPETPLAAQ
jgi:hypothetical protein